MTKKRCCLFVLVLFTSFDTGLYCQDVAKRPNIVFFLVDDLGWQDTSVAFWNEPSEFQQHFRTPNVERLARQGIRFSRAYSCSVCSPTRTSIMTGQNAARHQVTNWTFDPNKETSGQTNRLLPPENWNRKGLQPNQLTLPKLLNTVGYQTIHCGKAHWGAAGTAGADPTRLGFDVNIAGHHAGAPGSYQGKDNYGNNPDRPQRLRWAVPGLEKYHGTNTHLTDALAAEANAAIESAVTQNKPFFLYMAPYAVHTPIQQHVRFIDNYRGKKYPNGRDIPDAEAKYASLVEGYDDALGQILQKIESLKQSGNTIVVFTSDNGGLSVHGRGESPRSGSKNTHCWPLREGKGSAYEGGIRVPLVISWAKPVKNALQKSLPIEAGTESNSMVICEDYFPTICRWAGVDINSAAKQLAGENKTKFAQPVIDGQDISSSVMGQGGANDRDFFFHYPHVWGAGSGGRYQPHSSLISGQYKLIYFYHSRRWEFYDLQNDIGEKKNLFYDRQVDGMVSVLNTISSEFSNKIREYAAQLPEIKPGINYSRRQFDPGSELEPVASNEGRGQLAGWGAGKTWLDQHNDINNIAGAGKLELVFIGDSITQGWGGPGRSVRQVAPQVWGKFYSKRKVRNFGISGDGFRHLLWRIENGNLEGINPKVIVVAIGTNDLSRGDDPELVARGIEQVVQRIEERCQRSKILLLGIFPRGSDADNPMRLKADKVNRLLRKVADNRKTLFLDIGKQFLDEAGKALPSHYHDDFLHLSPEGYMAWAEAIEPVLKKQLLKK